jgi:AraC-like DNA-binding protein
MDTLRPYSWRQSERAEHYVLVLDDPDTGLTVEQLWQAADQLASSPLSELLRSHLRALSAMPADLAPEAMRAVGRASAELARAALLTAVDGPGADDWLEESLFARMAAFADSHLHDPELTPTWIAAEHFVSVRHLYTVWDRATGQSPHRWIMAQRLERASRLLAQRPRSALPISSVARQCGFTNMSHFSRRFREAYGLRPRDWSARHRQG